VPEGFRFKAKLYTLELATELVDAALVIELQTKEKAPNKSLPLGE
jgi:hypothetical protein